MLRDTAWRILNSHITNDVLIKHSLATEAVMRALAPRLQGDVDMWGMTGLLHDADYERAKGNPEKHGMLLPQLEPNTIPSLIEHAIQAHNYEETDVVPVNNLDWALICCDELTGLLVKAAKMQQDKKLASLTSQIFLDLLKQKEFIKDVKVTHLYLCEEKLGIPLEEFITIALSAMQTIHEELGL